MSTDLDLVGLRYNTVGAIFFVWIYILFGVQPCVTKTSLGSVHSGTSAIVSRSNVHLICDSMSVHRNVALKLFRPSRWSTVISFSVRL